MEEEKRWEWLSKSDNPSLRKELNFDSPMSTGEAAGHEEEESILITETPSATTELTGIYCRLGFSIIGPNDYLTLRRGTMINDEILNFIIHHHSMNNPHVHTFHSYFMTNYMAGAGSREEKFRRVARWTAGVDLKKKEAVFFPVNKDEHWYLLVVTEWNCRTVSITVLNSIPNYGGVNAAVTALSQYLETGFGVEQANLHRPCLPRQTSQNDCGLYVSLYLRYLIGDIEDFKVSWFSLN